MLDDMVIMGLYPLFSHKHKELRFAILLPFSALSDAENGRLSANFICHAPAPFDHAPADALFLPQATNRWAPTSLVPKRAHQSLQCHSAPSWGGQKWPPSATRQLDSGQRIFLYIYLPQILTAIDHLSPVRLSLGPHGGSSCLYGHGSVLYNPHARNIADFCHGSMSSDVQNQRESMHCTAAKVCRSIGDPVPFFCCPST